jgi:hypothetical protein
MTTIDNQEQWKCRSCVEVFDTRGKRNAHHRKLHQKFATGRAGRIQVQRSIAGKFVCECGNYYDQAQSLTRHRQGCYATIAMIEGGDNGSENVEGMFQLSEE